MSYILTMENISNLRRRFQQLRFSANILTNCRNNNLVFLVWHSLRKTGLVMSLDNGGVHWMANVAMASFLVTTVMQIIDLFLSINDPDRLFECFSILSFCGLGVIKLLSLRYDGDQWRNLLKEASKLEKEELNNENLSPLDYESDNEDEYSVSKYYVERYTKAFNATFKLLTRIYLFTEFVYITSPFIEYALFKYKNPEIVYYPHILPLWTPLDDVVFGYILTILLELISAAYCVSVHVAFDLSAVGLMMFIRGQFCLLHAKSERIGGKGKKYNLSKTRDLRAHLRIKNCHRLHIVLVSLVKQLNKLTKNILGIYFYLATITLCLVAVQLQSDLSTTQLMSLLQYMMATLTQLFLFCNYGDAVLNESTVGMGMSPQGSAWWCLSPRVRKELLLLGIGMSRRYELYAGPFFSLSLPSFIQIVRTAYSFYAVLRQKSS
ncbi:unnamed protein product [Parnassius mnemosyne]|uniref:Odorant receptor n=1 Tax=Parnassius mnemosyne TaxID=213953 RepID=A0AAV1M0J8_9NEOP